MNSTPPAIIPSPSRVTLREGEFLLQNSSRIEAPKALIREAEYLAAYLRRATGFPVPIGDPDQAVEKAPVIRLALDPD
jgi:hypothetical protein